IQVNHSIVLNHFYKLKVISKFDLWVPHDLSKRNMIDGISGCTSLPSRLHEKWFSNSTVTEDEK
ncbi:hypothetical protein WH47_06069, partial [Habropoda laboriosa]